MWARGLVAGLEFAARKALSKSILDLLSAASDANAVCAPVKNQRLTPSI